MVATSNRRHIPAEMVEEILLNLPLKSLVRFSSVSKSWETMIFKSGFVKRYRSRGHERIALRHGKETIFKKASTCLVSSISSHNLGATDFVCPFSHHLHEYDRCDLEANCGGLWLAVADDLDLLLWNPSIRTFRKLPAPSIPYEGFRYILGLGYDCVGDDYKVLKIADAATSEEISAELYSLKSDSWREIDDFPTNIDLMGGCAFVSRKLHFVAEEDNLNLRPAIICFDLSTEELGEVAPPNYRLSRWIGLGMNNDFRGKLSVSVWYEKSLHIWAMEEYGVAESWSRKFIVRYRNSVFRVEIECIVPLYVYENGEILMLVDDDKEKGRMFVYKDKKMLRFRCNFMNVDINFAENIQQK